jgi:hypothetical protein
LPIVFNEYEYAKSLLETKITVIYQRDLNFLAKLWDYENCPPSEIRKNLIDFCLKNDPYFNMIQNRLKLKRAISHAKRYKLRFPDFIEISRSELDLIKSINNYKYEKIIFCMLVCGKYFKTHPANKIVKDYIYREMLFNNQKIKDIFRIADIRMTIEEWNKAKHELTLMCVLAPTITNANKFGLGFKEDDSECVMTINDFRNIIGYYQEYCGESMINCEKCGVLMTKKGHNHKYCPCCWEKEQKELWRKNSKKYYHSL